MKTEDLITMLAAGVAPNPAPAAATRYSWALALAASVTLLLMVFSLGIRADLALAARGAMLWLKIGFCATLLIGGLIICLRLAEPGVALGRAAWIVVAPVMILWGIAIAVLADTDPASRGALVLGNTWARCPLLVAGLSAPGWVAFMWAMKGLAPTRLRLAGAATGLLAGGLAATIYSLHCPESTAPFIAIWYVLGILIPTVVGAWAGPRLLRW